MSFTINSQINQPQTSIVYNSYWKFAAERQSIFFKRLEETMPPWTNDNILRLFKFTNAYRAIDRVSQYLIKEVIYNGDQAPNEVLFRILLFKLFNKIDTWQSLKKVVGEIRYDTYDFGIYNHILDNLKAQGKTIYSGAYIMASGKSAFGHEYKHQNHLRLLESIMTEPARTNILNSKTLEELYNTLKSFPSIGSFLAYQYAIDLNYSNLTNFSEMDFVKAGPGAKDGIRKCFVNLGGYSEEDIIKWMTDRQFIEFDRLEINFQDLWGRPLQLIDCQNIFCEVDKYARVAHPEINSISNRVRIKQRFQPASLKSIDYYLPPKWGIIIPKSITI